MHAPIPFHYLYQGGRYATRSVCLSFVLSVYMCTLQFVQELSYRKQIARQLRTQYVEGIYDTP